jgi:hypothetical protein
MNSELPATKNPVFRTASGAMQILAVSIFAFVPLQSNAQDVPNAPAQLCIDGSSGCDAPVIGPPPPSNPDGKKWNPGHYLKVQGQPADSNQNKYWDGALNTIKSKMNDDPLIKGIHIGFAWGVLEPSQGQYDWGRMYEILDLVQASGKHVLAQVQTKGFGSNPTGYEMPADLSGANLVTSNSGKVATLWRDGSDGSDDVMGRYVTFMQAFAAEFDGHPALEVVMPAESAPSFGGNCQCAPVDYSVGKLATQYERLYAAMPAVWVETNFASNLNTLGGSSKSNEIPRLMEASYQAGIMTGGPDAKATIAYDAFEGTATGPVAVTRDYRGKMGSVYAVSQDVMGATPGDKDEDPPEVIIHEQNHMTTHLSWISGLSGDKSWGSILDAINANPSLSTACPTVYKGCQ